MSNKKEEKYAKSFCGLVKLFDIFGVYLIQLKIERKLNYMIIF